MGELLGGRLTSTRPACTSDGLVLLPAGQEIRVYQAHNARLLRRLQGHQGLVTTVLTDPNNSKQVCLLNLAPICLHAFVCLLLMCDLLFKLRLRCAGLLCLS